MLGVQCAPIAGQFFCVVVDGVNQILRGSASFPLEDQIFPQDCQLVEGGRRGCGGGFLPPLALLFILVGLRRGSVLCLRHHGMIAPIPSAEKPLGFGAGAIGRCRLLVNSLPAKSYSASWVRTTGAAPSANWPIAFNRAPLPRINLRRETSLPQPNHFDCAPNRPFTGGHWLEAPCLKLLQRFFYF